MRMIKKLTTLILLTSVPTLAHALNVEAECNGGLAEGSYRAATDEGVVRITGEYRQGKRYGTFTVYDPAGERLVELPYKDGLLNGTIQAWYTPGTSDVSDSQPKVMSEVLDDVVEGQYKTWYPDGAKRSIALINEGTVTSFEAWEPDGSPLKITDQLAFLDADIETDFVYYEQLEQVLNSYPPNCSG